MIKVLIFDFDGLIFDTETIDIKSFEALYQDYNNKFPREKWLKSVGTRLSFDPYQELLAEHPELNKEQLVNEHHKHYQQILKGKTLREGVLDYLTRAKELGLKIALASSSHKKWIDDHFERFDIRHFFDFLSTADDVKLVKPDPELYNNVLDFFDIEPKEAIAFEDSPNGSLASIRAQIPVVIVPNETTKDIPFDERVNLRLNSKKDMSLDEVINQVIKDI